MPCSLLEVLAELLVSSTARALLESVESLATAATIIIIGCVCCSLLGSPASVFTSCLMVALSGSPWAGSFSSAEPWSEQDASFSPLLPEAALVRPSLSLSLLSSEERGDGRLSVSELLLAPPGGREEGRGSHMDQMRRAGGGRFCVLFQIFFRPNQVSPYNNGRTQNRSRRRCEKAWGA